MMTVCLGIAKSRPKGTLIIVEWLFGCLHELLDRLFVINSEAVVKHVVIYAL